jgi:uncharacterized protein
MPRTLFSILFSLLLGAATFAQTPVRPNIVRATGQASASAQPDRAVVNAGVITKAKTADEAASQNATQVESVLVDVRGVLGPAAEIRTLSYSLNPNYIHSSGRTPVLDGYTASNTVEITIENLSLIGKVIDAAIGGGATNMQGLRFTVKDPEPLRQKALGLAAKQALANAAAIADGLDREVGDVLVASQGSNPVYVQTEFRDLAAGAGSTTPIETGLVEIHATVTVEAELR